jgi:hypothetical protein
MELSKADRAERRLDSALRSALNKSASGYLCCSNFTRVLIMPTSEERRGASVGSCRWQGTIQACGSPSRSACCLAANAMKRKPLRIVLGFLALAGLGLVWWESRGPKPPTITFVECRNEPAGKVAVFRVMNESSEPFSSDLGVYWYRIASGGIWRTVGLKVFPPNGRTLETLPAHASVDVIVAIPSSENTMPMATPAIRDSRPPQSDSSFAVAFAFQIGDAATVQTKHDRGWHALNYYAQWVISVGWYQAYRAGLLNRGQWASRVSELAPRDGFWIVSSSAPR